MNESEFTTAMYEPADLPAHMSNLEKFADWSSDQLVHCHSSLQRLYEYWSVQRGDRPMPARGDIDPIDLKELLPLLILIDVVSDPRRYVYRLVGTHEVEIRGTDPTGKAVDEAYYGESSDTTAAYLDRVVFTRRPLLYRGTYQPLRTRTQREDVLFLPLSQDGETVNMIMVLGHIDWMKDAARV
jgi:hypothetical protein